MTTAPFGNAARTSWPLLLAWLVGVSLAMPSLLHAQADLDEQVRSIAAELRCPVCQNLSVADSPAELAREMRGVIREQLQAGKRPEEIKAYFVSKYGDWVLLSPRPRGLNLLVWVGPFAGAAVGLAMALLAARRWARGPRVRARGSADPVLLEQVRRKVATEDAELGLASPEGLSALELEQENLYAALRELDFDYRAGKLSSADYEALRAEYEARAVECLTELHQRAPSATVKLSAHQTLATGQPDQSRIPARRPWRLVAGGIFLLVFGVSLGYFLTQSLRARLGEQDTLTGDFLTGTGAGGVAPGSRQPAQNLDGLLASGRAAAERQDWKDATEAFKQALVLDPDNLEANTFLGLILLRAGHGDEALQAIERALAIAPNYLLALWAKGLILFESKQDYAGAIQAWETLMATDLSETDAEHVARMLTDARERLAARPSTTR